MRVLIVGEADARLAEGLAGRFRAAGSDVIGPLAPAAAPTDTGATAALAANAEAAVDACVVDTAWKATVLAALDDALPSGAPLLTCCHAVSATAVAAALATPERVTGFALLPPWADRTTVECARARQTAPWAAEATEAVWRSIGLEPAWVGDSPGLVLPRLVACLANEAAFAVMEGAARPTDIDRAMELGTRYPRGPLAWAELVGPDHVLATLDALAAELGHDVYRAAPLLRQRVRARGQGWVSEATAATAGATSTPGHEPLGLRRQPDARRSQSGKSSDL